MESLINKLRAEGLNPQSIKVTLEKKGYKASLKKTITHIPYTGCEYDDSCYQVNVYLVVESKEFLMDSYYTM